MTPAQKYRVLYKVTEVLTESLCECGHWHTRHSRVRCHTPRCPCREFRPVKFRRVRNGVELVA